VSIERSIEGCSGAHFVRQDLEIGHGIICAVHACWRVLSSGDQGGMRYRPAPMPTKTIKPLEISETTAPSTMCGTSVNDH